MLLHRVLQGITNYEDRDVTVRYFLLSLISILYLSILHFKNEKKTTTKNCQDLISTYSYQSI